MSRIVGNAVLLALGVNFLGCAGEDAPPPSANKSGVVFEVVARGLTFEAPSETPSGWTTLRFTNQAGMVHFAVVERMPEGHGAQDHQDQVAPVFQEGYELLTTGEADAAMEKFGEIPAWFGDVVFVGGPGLTAPGRTSQATVYLEPGDYVLECWVKTDDVFHSYNPDPEVWGMVRPFTVTEAISETPEPTGSLTITISSENGIQMTGDPASGRQTFAVHYQDQRVHENFLGHDIHLARISEDTDLDALGAWMDWTRPDGLETPAPVTFVGGLNEMAAGATGYFTVTLEPGRYALVAEVSNPQEKGMLRTFTVEGD